MKTFREIKNESRGIEPAPVMVVAGNPNVIASAKERKKGGRVKRTSGKSVGVMSGRAVKARADRPRRAVGGQLQAPAYMQQPALAPVSGVGGAPYQITGGGLARGGTTRRRRDDIREAGGIHPTSTYDHGG